MEQHGIKAYGNGVVKRPSQNFIENSPKCEEGFVRLLNLEEICKELSFLRHASLFVCD